MLRCAPFSHLHYNSISTLRASGCAAKSAKVAQFLASLSYNLSLLRTRAAVDRFAPAFCRTFGTLAALLRPFDAHARSGRPLRARFLSNLRNLSCAPSDLCCATLRNLKRSMFSSNLCTLVAPGSKNLRAQRGPRCAPKRTRAAV
jgi:hypothetical protein